jgi:hypothetical protein
VAKLWTIRHGQKVYIVTHTTKTFYSCNDFCSIIS